MATYQIEDSYPPFEYGSSVRWTDASASIYEGGICGFTKVGNETKAIACGVPLGTVLVLVELASGELVKVPIDKLKLIDDDL
jgi:hypothetical protein